MNNLFLGIDTSNYKTSIAITDIHKNIVFQRSEFLDVKHGDRGLRQSEAFFQHSNKLPVFIEDAFSIINPADISAIGVSSRPRSIDGSYMPCFLAGINAARELSAALNIPLYRFSHQEGHAAAILEYNDSLSNLDSCLFFHLSGGTTEFLRCVRNDIAYDMNIVGGTKDISIGQLIDRIGVKQNYPFPAGRYMDDIAINTEQSIGVIPNIKSIDNYFNLSGIESSILRYSDIHSHKEMESVVAELFESISNLLFNSACNLASTYEIDTVCLAGGVASSKFIRARFGQMLSDIKSVPFNFIFAEPEFSGDNAVGISLLTSRNYR